MTDPMPASISPSTLSDRGGVPAAVRAQILATEHWSLLATRSMTWNEVFSRASMYLTVLSAAVVALALVAQATAFGPGFRLFAVLVLPVVLLLGVATVVRVGDANNEDLNLLIGMNRLRHAYLELAPELEPYFVTEHHDDLVSVIHSSRFVRHPSLDLGRILASTPSLIGAINAIVAGVFAALVADALGASNAVTVAVGVVAGVVAAVSFGALALRSIANVRRAYRPRFPR